MKMDEIAQLHAGERILYFIESASRIGLSPQVVEKDFWVCWILRRVFALTDIGSHITFKGGTSLSKAYGAIRRFSEDVDLAVERSFLGFDGPNDPETAASGKLRRRLRESLSDACKKRVAADIVPQLKDAVSSPPQGQEWRLDLDAEDAGGQTVLFQFPSTDVTGQNNYFLPSVKLQIGARSDHFPVESRQVRPYVQDAVASGLLSDPDTMTRVLRIDRTYWEKATILHMLAHAPMDKAFGVRMSRHYYDLFMLADHPEACSASQNTDLLLRVAIHKASYFSQATAKYQEARPGSLRLVPDDRRMDDIEQDYRKMAPMFFESQPDLLGIMARLQALQDEINHTAP